MKNLFPFQVNNAKALHKMFSENKRLLLADETGLGKTYSTVLLIAMLALDKRQKSKPSGKKEKTWKSHFNVLYICSNERIARKNMDELCKELCEKDLPAQAHELLDTQDTYNLDPLMAESDRKTMSTRRNARLSIPMETYETSYINLYNTTPETSFRKGNSATVGGTREERAALKTARKDCPKKECTECDCFAECRKNVSISNFNSKQFDLIILDEFQSFEDILSNAWENNTDKIILYLDELLSNNNNNNCKLLMLSATPYQTKASDLDSLRDFKRILSFLNPKLSQPFNYYCQQLNDPNAKLSVLETAKKAFEELFQQVCRRNQRSDVDIDQDLHSHIYGEQRGIEGLFEEFVACQDVFSKDKEIFAFNAQGQEIDIPKLIPAMCQNTPWPASFSKGCKLRKSLDDLDYDDKLYFQIDNAARFLPSNDTGLQCTRILDPRSLKVPSVWPNWKGEQVRRIALGDNIYQNLLKCIWLPPSNPDHEPDEQSPYAPFYKNPPSKTIVFCEYMMTTRAIAAALSIEAVSGAGCFDLPEEEWQSLCLAPEQPTNGHPYCCALDALKRVANNDKNSDTLFDVAAVKAAQELVAYLRRDEIRAVLQKAGVTDKKSLLRYCHDGNLTAVLEEYWSERKPKLPTSELFYALCDAINADPEFQKKNFGRGNQRKNFVTAMEYIWKNRAKEIGGLKSHLEAARRTDVAFHTLLDSKYVPPKSCTYSNYDKTWFMPVGYACEKTCSTYANSVFSKYGASEEDNDIGLCLPNNNQLPFVDDLVTDQIRVCADLLENGKTTLHFKEMYYSASPKSELKLPKETEFECGRTGIREGKPLVLGSQGLFSSVVLDLWDACTPCSDLLPTLPKSHICIDSQNIQCAQNECEDNRGGHCARIPLGFACRYNEAVQDTRDHNENGAEQIAASFNSPFYPFVLLTSDVAKEGLSFHLYCRKLIHLRQTQRPAELIQRNGRVDRYHSLALRQRLAKNSPSCSDWEEKWKWARDEAQKNAYTGMQPDWHLPAQNGDPKIEIYYLDHPATFEVMKSVAMQSAAQWYTQVLGSLLPDSLLEKLRNRYGACLESDLINAVKLNLCPNPDDLLKISQTQSSSNQ